MGGIKKKIQRLFGGGKKKSRRDGNLSEFSPQSQGLGQEGLTGLGMTESGTDLGDWGNGAILDELAPPVPSRKDRPELTTARRDNPTGLRGRSELTTARRGGPVLGSHRQTNTDLDTGEEGGGVGEDTSSDTSTDTPTLDLLNQIEPPPPPPLEGSGKQGAPPEAPLLSPSQTIPEAPPQPGAKYDDVAKLGKRFEGEDKDAPWRSRTTNSTGGRTTTEYLDDPKEREKRRLEVDDKGRLVKGGQLLDTGKVDKEGKHVHGEDLFAMSPEGEILSSNPTMEQDRLDQEQRERMDREARAYGKNTWEELTDEERAEIIEAGGGMLAFFHHSSFFSGKDVAGAGSIKSKEGVLKELTPDSGHYTPDIGQTMNTLTELKDQGVNLDHARVGVHKRDEDGNVLANPRNPRDVEKEFFHPGEMFSSEGDEKTLMGKKSFVHQIEEIGSKARKDKYLSEDLLDQLEDGTLNVDDVRAKIESEGTHDIEELDHWQVEKEKNGVIKKKDEYEVSVLNNLADPRKLMHHARGKKNAPKRPRSEKPKEFTSRGDTGSAPSGEKKYDRLKEIGGKYQGEHQHAKWRDPGTENLRDTDSRERTAGLTDEGRDKRRLHVGEDGLLYDSGGLLLDTTQSGGKIREDMDEGSFLFAMDETGDILTTDGQDENVRLRKMRDEALERKERGEFVSSEELDKQHFHHSSFFGGRDVAGAGGLRARDGKAVTLTPNSGHYFSGNDQTMNVMEELLDRGVDVNDLKVDMLTSGKELPETQKARTGTIEEGLNPWRRKQEEKSAGERRSNDTDRMLGDKRMQYLAGGAVKAAMGTEDDKGVTREKTMQRLETQVELLDQVRRLRYLAGSDETTRALEDQMVELMLNGAGGSEIRKHVEDLGYEVAELNESTNRIKIMNSEVSPSKLNEVAKPGNRKKYEEDEAKRDKDRQTFLGKRREDRSKGLWKPNSRSLPEWAITDGHRAMWEEEDRKEAKRRKREEKKKKAPQPSYSLQSGPKEGGGRPYGFVSEEPEQKGGGKPYGFVSEEDEKKEGGGKPYGFVSEEPEDKGNYTYGSGNNDSFQSEEPEKKENYTYGSGNNDSFQSEEPEKKENYTYGSGNTYSFQSEEPEKKENYTYGSGNTYSFQSQEPDEEQEKRNYTYGGGSTSHGNGGYGYGSSQAPKDEEQSPYSFRDDREESDEDDDFDDDFDEDDEKSTLGPNVTVSYHYSS